MGTRRVSPGDGCVANACCRPKPAVERGGVEPPAGGLRGRCSPVELPSRGPAPGVSGGHSVVRRGQGSAPERPRKPSSALVMISIPRENRKGPTGPGESSRTIQSRSGVGRARPATEHEPTRPASRRRAPRLGRWRRGSGATPTHPASRHYSVVVKGRERSIARALGGRGRIRTFDPDRDDRCLGPLGYPTRYSFPRIVRRPRRRVILISAPIRCGA